jgi:hypothetical protein
MSTFSKIYLNLMKNNPIEKKSLELLGELYKENHDNSNKVFPLPIFLERLSLSPSPASYSIITFLENKGLVKKIIRVESPTCGGIGDFDSLLDVPDVLEDFRTGLDITVTSDNIKVLYSLTKNVEVFE